MTLLISPAIIIDVVLVMTNLDALGLQQRRGGFVFPNNSELLLRGSTFIAQEKVGRGNVVMFTSEPMFRGWWRALDRLVLNAVLLGTAF